jgi:hypothetical protein
MGRSGWWLGGLGLVACAGGPVTSDDDGDGGGTGSAGLVDDTGGGADGGGADGDGADGGGADGGDAADVPCARAEVQGAWTRPAEGALGVASAGDTLWVIEGAFGETGLALQAHAPDGTPLDLRVAVDIEEPLGDVSIVGRSGGRVGLLVSDPDRLDHTLLLVGPEGVEATADIDGEGVPELAATDEGWLVAEAGLRGGRLVALDASLQTTATVAFGGDVELVVEGVVGVGDRAAVAWREATGFSQSPPRIEVLDLAAGTGETLELPSESSYGDLALGPGPEDHVRVLESLGHETIRAYEVDLDDPSPAGGGGLGGWRVVGPVAGPRAGPGRRAGVVDLPGERRRPHDLGDGPDPRSGGHALGRSRAVG